MKKFQHKGTRTCTVNVGGSHRISATEIDEINIITYRWEYLFSMKELFHIILEVIFLIIIFFRRNCRKWERKWTMWKRMLFYSQNLTKLLVSIHQTRTFFNLWSENKTVKQKIQYKSAQVSKFKLNIDIYCRKHTLLKIFLKRFVLAMIYVSEYCCTDL